jgi:hypothetical protein
MVAEIDREEEEVERKVEAVDETGLRAGLGKPVG